MRVVLPYPPALNTMYRSVVIGGYARVLLSKEARKYKETVAERCVKAGLTTPVLKPGLVSLQINLFRARKAGDIDGPLKGLLDSLQGFIYESDSQISQLHVYRMDDKGNPRVEVWASPAPA